MPVHKIHQCIRLYRYIYRSTCLWKIYLAFLECPWNDCGLCSGGISADNIVDSMDEDNKTILGPFPQRKIACDQMVLVLFLAFWSFFPPFSVFAHCVVCCYHLMTHNLPPELDKTDNKHQQSTRGTFFFFFFFKRPNIVVTAELRAKWTHNKVLPCWQLDVLPQLVTHVY